MSLHEMRFNPHEMSLHEMNLHEMLNLILHDKAYMCDGFRALAAVSPGCLATVVKSHKTWIPTLCLHPPILHNANGGPQGSHLTPPSNGCRHLCGCRACAPLLNFL